MNQALTAAQQQKFATLTVITQEVAPSAHAGTTSSELHRPLTLMEGTWWTHQPETGVYFRTSYRQSVGRGEGRSKSEKVRARKKGRDRFVQCCLGSVPAEAGFAREEQDSRADAGTGAHSHTGSSINLPGCYLARFSSRQDSTPRGPQWKGHPPCFSLCFEQQR